METTRPAGGAGARLHYDRHPYEVGVDASAYLREAGALGKFLRSVDGGRVLDIGCGPANLLPALLGHTDKPIGVDISAVSLRWAAERVGREAVLVQADARRLPLRDACMVHIVATGSLHHTGDARAAFAELARVLRPGGRAFVSLYASGSYYERMYRSVGGLARRARGDRIAHLAINQCVLLPAFALYFVAGRLASRRRLERPSFEQIQNYFADQLLNTTVSFHSASQVGAWADALGLRVTSSATAHAGALLQAVVTKPDGEEPRQAHAG